MSIVIKTGYLQAKNENGDYIVNNTVAEKTTAEQIEEIEAAGSSQIAAVQQKGVETRASIPDDYTALSNTVSAMSKATSLVNKNAISWLYKRYIDAEGTETTNSYAARSDYQACESGDVLRYVGQRYDDNNYELILYVHFYNADKEWISRTYASNTTIVIPQDVYYWRLTYGRASSTGVEISESDISSYFDIEVIRKFAPIDSASELVLCDKVGAMLSCAETYFDYAYQPGGPHLVYLTQHGLFSDDIYSVDYPNAFAIVCSQFAMAVAKGIRFENSRYVLGAEAVNRMQDWGFMTDGTGIYGKEAAGESDSTAAALDYMWAAEMFRYAETKGFPTYTITESHPMLRPGDFIFSANNNDTNAAFYKHIRHVALVVGVGYENGRVTVVESWESTKHDGNSVGLRVRTAQYNTFQYGARFPIDSSPCKSKLIFSCTDFPSGGYTQGTVAVFPIQLSKGFYTFVLHGTVESGSLEFAVWYAGDTSETVTRVASLKNGNVSYGIVYIEDYPMERVTITRAPNAAYSVQDFAIYRGYFKPDSGVYGSLI